MRGGYKTFRHYQTLSQAFWLVETAANLGFNRSYHMSLKYEKFYNLRPSCYLRLHRPSCLLVQWWHTCRLFDICVSYRYSTSYTHKNLRNLWNGTLSYHWIILQNLKWLNLFIQRRSLELCPSKFNWKTEKVPRPVCKSFCVQYSNEMILLRREYRLLWT